MWHIYFFPDNHSDPRLILDGKGDLTFQGAKLLNFFIILKLLEFDIIKLVQNLTIFEPKILYLDKVFFEQKIFFDL